MKIHDITNHIANFDIGIEEEETAASKVDKEAIENAVRQILIAIGEDPDREGLLETPQRVASMYEEVFAGLHTDPLNVVKVFQEACSGEMILVKDIDLYSMCEHHLLPFMGVCHVAYIPREGQVLGLSKVARIVEILAKKPQLQERLCNEIADTIMESCDALGAAVAIEAEHLCMTMRGVRKPGSRTVTSAFRGVMEEESSYRSEFFNMIR